MVSKFWCDEKAAIAICDRMVSFMVSIYHKTNQPVESVAEDTRQAYDQALLQLRSLRQSVDSNAHDHASLLPLAHEIRDTFYGLGSYADSRHLVDECDRLILALSRPYKKRFGKYVWICVSLLILAAVGVFIGARHQIIASTNTGMEIPAHQITVKNQHTIAIGVEHSLCVKNDGSVVASGSNFFGETDVSGWDDIVSVAAGSAHSLGLRSDGTVVATGQNTYGQCNVTDWKDIVSISASPYCSFGVRSDGTVLATGDNEYGQCNVQSWQNIVAVEASTFHTVGLQADGKVVAIGSNEYGECNVANWENIVAIDAEMSNTVALTADGRVFAIGDNSSGQCNVSSWSNVSKVFTTWSTTIGITDDGSIIGQGDIFDTWYLRNSMQELHNVVDISVGFEYYIALDENGMVFADGADYMGQCEIGGESNIMLPKGYNR